MRWAAAALALVVVCGGGLVARERQAPAGAEAAGDDVTLPFDPLEKAALGAWARYRVLDPADPKEKLPHERYQVVERTERSVLVMDGGAGTHRFVPGDRSARGFVRGFLGQLGAHLELQAVSVSAEPITVGTQRYDDAVRIEARLGRELERLEGESPMQLEARLRLWLSPSVPVLSIVRGEIALRLPDASWRRGVIELDALGRERPPEEAGREAPAAASGTAAPKGG